MSVPVICRTWLCCPAMWTGPVLEWRKEPSGMLQIRKKLLDQTVEHHATLIAWLSCHGPWVSDALNLSMSASHGKPRAQQSPTALLY